MALSQGPGEETAVARDVARRIYGSQNSVKCWPLPKISIPYLQLPQSHRSGFPFSY